MARVHCTDCDMPVVVDPTGMCPEGHIVAGAGQRGVQEDSDVLRELSALGEIEAMLTERAATGPGAPASSADRSIFDEMDAVEELDALFAEAPVSPHRTHDGHGTAVRTPTPPQAAPGEGRSPGRHSTTSTATSTDARAVGSHIDLRHFTARGRRRRFRR